MCNVQQLYIFLSFFSSNLPFCWEMRVFQVLPTIMITHTLADAIFEQVNKIKCTNHLEIKNIFLQSKAPQFRKVGFSLTLK